MSLPPLGLYIHLPWCERKCPYCDFNSHQADRIPEARYIDRLLADLRADQHLAGDRTVETLFIGGGTPSLFSARAIDTLMRGIREILPLSPDLEATMEANPGSAEAEKFAGFRQAGINRLSLGVQSFDDHCLHTLGRIHDGDQARAAIKMALGAGFDSLNIDLMHGLPGQTIESALIDLQTAMSFEPPHLSWYQLTIEPNTVFHKRPPALPVEDVLADIQEAGEAALLQGGYLQYEVSAWSQLGYQCRHNLNYWTFGDYLGIGAGAHGKITSANGEITRYAKTRAPADYMDSSGEACTTTCRILSPADIRGEFMMNALRQNGGFTRSLFEARTSQSFTSVIKRIEQLQQQGLVAAAGETITTTELGRRYLDSVAGEFFDQV